MISSCYSSVLIFILGQRQLCGDHYICSNGFVKVNCSHPLLITDTAYHLTVHQIGGNKTVIRHVDHAQIVELPFINPSRSCFLNYLCQWWRPAFNNSVIEFNKTVTISLKGNGLLLLLTFSLPVYKMTVTYA